MDTNTFSLEQIRLELSRLGYDSLSKQTLLKFQNDLEELARNEKTQSICQSSVVFINFFLILIEHHETKRSIAQQQSNVDFKVNYFIFIVFFSLNV
jgi:hypothetical protein